MMKATRFLLIQIAISLSVLFIAGACTKTRSTVAITLPAIDTLSDTARDTIIIPPQRKAFTYLALGDSYTIGQSVNMADRFPQQTVAKLFSDSLINTTLTYIATTGWTTASLLAATTSQNPATDYDVVTLLIGVNDQYQGVDTAAYRSHFVQCLQEAIRLAANKSSHVVVLSIPDYSATPFVNASDKARVSKEIDWFNAINRQVTQQYNIVYVDVTPASRLAATDATLIAGDGLHPSGRQYAVWAQLLYPAMARILK